MLSIILVLLLVVIAYQDLRHQRIQWILIAGAAGINFMMGIYRLPMSQVLLYTLMNCLFIIFNIGLLAAYLSIRFKADLRSMFSTYLGIGDVLFWISLAPMFSTINFIYFHLFSLLASLIVFIFLKTFIVPLKKSTVPLAGLQAVFYSFVMIAVWCGWEYDFYNDLGFFDLSDVGNG